MLGNDIKIALRNLRKNKAFAVINIASLAIGICASLVIFLIVNHEFSFDKNWKNGNQIYRVVSSMHFPNMLFKNSGAPGPLGKAIKQELPAIEEAASLSECEVSKLQVGSAAPENVFKKQEGIWYTEPQFFNIFNYNWIIGSPGNSLNEPYNIVLAESRAKLYFPNQALDKIIGQQLILDDTIRLTVSGIVEDIKDKTEINYKGFISFATFRSLGLEDDHGYNQWGSLSSINQLFARVKSGSDTAKLGLQISAIQMKNSGEKNFQVDHFLQPVSDIHFNQDYNGFTGHTANRKIQYGLLALAAFLLALGCINFINLTTAQSSQRAKEIGIRKTLGSSRNGLIRQFLGETFMVTLISTTLSVLLAPWLLKLFGDFIPSGLSFNLMQEPRMIIFLILLVILVTLLSGFYPALVLSGYKPVLVLKNQILKSTAGSRTEWLRKTLTVSQFIIAQFFIIATIVVGKQIHYSMNMDMGFKKEAILYAYTPFAIEHPESQLKQLVQKIKSFPEIRQVSLSGVPPAVGGLNMTSVRFNDGKKEISTTVEIQVVDTTYYSLFGLRLLAGRWLEPADTTREYVINEKFARELGFQNPADAINKRIERGRETMIPIVGVIADFHSKSLHEPIKSMVLGSNSNRQRVLNIALHPNGNGESWKRAIDKMTKAYKETYPDSDFEYTFLDDGIAELYKAEQDLSKLLRWAAGLAVFISCLGLFGLVIYTSNQRVKEIGIRKVLGASVRQIVTLLSRDFLKLVLVAPVIAIPIGWWATQKWLEGFAFRTNLSWWIFGLSGVVMILLALVTLSFKTINAAMNNPVDSLRNE